MAALTFDDDLASNDAGPTDGGRLVVHASSINPASRDLMIRTVIGEASNQPDEGQAAVAHVIMNRVNSGKFGKDIPNVVLAPKQFEPWQTRRRELERISPDSPAYQRAAGIVDGVLSGDAPDPTGGATHFLEPNIVMRRYGRLPAWAQGEGQKIGDHVFFYGKGRQAPAGAGQVADSAATAFAPTEQPNDVVGAALAQNRASSSNVLTFDDDLAKPPVDAGVTTGPTRPAMSTGTAALTGVASGITANFIDELIGAKKAGNYVLGPAASGALEALPIANNLVPMIGGLAALYQKATGSGDGAILAYKKGRDAVRAMQQQAQAEHPVAYGVGEVGGALATAPLLPAANVAKGAGLAARAINSGVTGGALGALAGAGAGEGTEDTLAQAATGGLIGGTGGAALTPVIAGVTGAARGLTSGITKRGRERVAARQVENAFRKDGTNSAAVANELENSGAPLIAADLGGEATRRTADAASIKSADAANAFKGKFDARADNQGRFADIIDAVPQMAWGSKDSTITSQLLDKVKRTESKVVYDIARKQGARPIWDQSIEGLTVAPEMRAAMKSATTTSANKAAVDGYKPPKSPFEFADDGTMRPVDGVHPTLDYWDHVKQTLDDRVSTLLRSGEKAAAGDVKAIKDKLVESLDAMVPEYKTARATYSRFAKAENAVEAGENFVSQKMDNTEARQLIAKMTPEQRVLFGNGFASTLIKSTAERSDRRNVLEAAFLNSPAARERIEIALGKDAAREVEAFIRTEGMMRETANAVRGNSKTMQRLVDSGIGGLGLGINSQTGEWTDPTSVGTMMIVGALTKTGRRVINEKVATQVGKLLSSGSADDLRKVSRMAARDPRLMDALRRADAFVGRTLGNAGSDLKLLPTNAPARADEQE